MSLKLIAKGWKVDIQPGGRHKKRYRKIFKTKAEAQRYINYVNREVDKDSCWKPKLKDNRTLQDLIDTWYQIHGSTLSDHKRRKAALDAICQTIGNPKAVDFTASQFVEYRAAKLKVATPNTVNHHHAYLRAVFSELIRSGHWQGDNPLSNLRRLKVSEQELAYLTHAQVLALLKQLRLSRNKDAYSCVVLCLVTGARWSEVQYLRAENVQRSSITFIETKSGKHRTVPVNPVLLKSIPKPKYGRLFKECYGAFKKALERAGIELPKGQKAHVLRHTFASHFMQQGGNVMVLQRILGHQSLHMTMRYAHFAPEHLKQAIEYNPLSELTLG